MSGRDDVPKQVRIRTDPEEGYAHRYDTIEQAASAWGCNKTRAVLLSCEVATFVLNDLEVILSDPRIPPEVTEDIIERLDNYRLISTVYTPPSIQITESSKS